MVTADSLSDKTVFFGLDDGQLAKIAAVAEEISLAGGTVLFREGDPGDSLFIVEDGAVDLLLEAGEGRQVKLATLGPGEVIGEVTFVHVEPRSATAVAASEPTVLIMLKHGEIAEVFRSDQGLLALVLLNITRTLSKRLRMANRKILQSHGP